MSRAKERERKDAPKEPRNRKEKPFNASEEDYRLLASNFPNGIVVVLDRDLRILLLEGEEVSRLGLPAKELIGTNLKDILSEDARATMVSNYAKVLKGEKVELDIPFQGSLLHAHVIPLKEQGQVWKALVVGTDVTQQRAQEEALRTSEERLRSVFDHALLGIYRTTPEGRIIMANPALIKLLGFSSFEELSRRNLNVEGFDTNTPRQVFLDRIDKQGAVHGMESTWMRADGKLIYIQDSATAIKDANGRTLYYEGTIVDVTETNAYRNQIEQLNQSLRVVNSILRHDIMNDLTVAIGSVDLYRRKGDAKLLDMAEGSMRKCSRLIRKMKELESIISNNALKTMSARDVIREVLGNYSSHSVDFQVEGDGLILADEAVVPALDNVISNAVVHGRSDKVEVKVASSEDKRWCEVRVCDHGKGVPDEIKELIFHEGFRYGDTGNTGLGLYIVKKTMERYGGQVRVEDLRPSGAAFILRFRSPVGGQFVGRSLPA